MPIIAVYSTLEVCLFFGCQKYNWPLTLTFRILFVLHDLAYFITYALLAVLNYDESKYDCDWITEDCAEYPNDYAVGCNILVAKFCNL